MVKMVQKVTHWPHFIISEVKKNGGLILFLNGTKWADGL